MRRRARNLRTEMRISLLARLMARGLNRQAACGYAVKHFGVAEKTGWGYVREACARLDRSRQAGGMVQVARRLEGV